MLNKICTTLSVHWLYPRISLSMSKHKSCPDVNSRELSQFDLGIQFLTGSLLLR